MFKLLKDWWHVHVEYAKWRKAMRILKNQEWSLEFVLACMKLCATRYPKKEGYTWVLKQKDGTELWLNLDTPMDKINDYARQYQTLEQKYDNLAVDSYMHYLNTRRHHER